MALLRAGGNIKVVQELAGHSSLEMTLQSYVQAFRMDRRSAVERLPWCKKSDLIAPHQTRETRDKGTRVAVACGPA